MNVGRTIRSRASLRGIARAIPIVLVAAVAIACASKDAFDGRVYHNGRIGFRAGPVPSSWERVSIDGPLLAFKDHESGGAIDVYARCGKDNDDVPLVALTNHLLIGFTEREFLTEEVIPFDAREARHTVVRAKLDGVLVVLDIYVMKKDGCVYDLVYVASPDHFERGRGAFESFVAGFATV